MGSTSSGAAVTSSPTPTCALGLCRAHAWSDLLQLVESVPEAATADGSTAIYPLFAAIEERCSLAVLEALAAAHPQALHARDSRGRLPLHQALIQGAPSEVVFKLLALHPNGACSVMGDKGPLPLHLAIQKQADISVVKALVEVNGPAAKHADSEGRLPLHVAAAWKAPAAVVSSLLDLHPAAIHHADGNGFLPLHAAATGGALVSVLDLLIKANPQAAQCPDDFGFLPLHRAVANQASEDVIIALVKAYPEAVRLPDNDGMLPLHIAVENDAALPVVERLLALHPGAAGQADQDGFLPLHMAVHAGAAKDVICCLLSGFHGALHARETKDGMQPLHIAATRLDSLPLVPVLLEGCKDNEISIAAEKDASGNLPLYLASGFVCEGQEAAISVLLRTYPEGAATRAWDRGGLANTNVKCDGCGVLIPVGRRRYSSRLISDIDLCQSCFTGTKEITWDREEMELVKYGDLPLHRALASGAPVAVVRLLLDAYPDAAKLQNHEGCLPLQIAARRSKVLLIFEMILQCSDSDAVSASDHSGNLPLHSAVCRSEPVLGIVKLLLRSCPDTVLVANLAGQTPLQAAVAACAPAPVVHELLSAQALKLDADAHRQLVPAHGLVVQQQYLEIVSELLEKGMWDMGLWADSMGRAALDIAHADIKSRLLKAACFVRRYDIQSSRCLHESMTSLVLSATDYGVDPPCKVALKFMTCLSSFEQEIKMRSQLAGRYVIMPLRAVVDSDAFSREHLDASLLLGSVGDGKTVLDIHQVTGMHAELCNLWKRQAFTTEDSHQRNPAVRRDPHLSVTRKISSLGAAPKTTTFKEYTCCIVMEMAELTLKDLLIHNQEFAGLDYDLVRQILSSVAAVLQHLYENGIVHCDLKPHNIVQTAGLKWKLLDFDCAHTENQPYTRNGKRPSSGVSPPEVNQIFTSSVDTTVSCHHVSYSHDLWSFGVLAYRLCHGRGGHLWNVNEFDELESEQEMKRAANCGPADIDLAMRKICGNSAWRIPVSMRGFNVAAAAEAMVAKLLEPNPKKRASNFPKPEDLLVEPFFTGQNSMVETVSELKRAIDGLRRDIQHTGTVTETHISLLEADVQALLMQQKDSTRAILQAVASHSQNECPSVFVVTPYAWRDEFRWRASPNEQTEPSNRHSKWVDFACKLIGALSDPETSAQEVLQDAVYKRFLLRLLCEGCLKPQGAGYIIDKPGDLADDLLVMLRLSIRAVAAARLGIGVAKCFLPFLPEVPEAASTKLMQACQALEGSSGQEYIEEAKGREGMIGAAMRTWVNFLNERDPQHDWGSLNKVILDSHNGSYSAKAGAAMWVCSDCMLRSQPSSSTYCSTTKGSQGLVVDGSMLLKCAEALQPDTLSAEPAEPHVEIKGSRLCIIQ